MRLTRFNPKRHRNHDLFEGHPLCRAKNAWALSRYPVTCSRCIQIKRDAVQIANSFVNLAGSLRGLVTALEGKR